MRMEVCAEAGPAGYSSRHRTCQEHDAKSGCGFQRHGELESKRLTDNAAVITVSNLIKQFGRFAALRGVTAEFAGGKLYAILGDNGAGKTTLLRTLAGLNEPSSGQVKILGANKFHDICQQVGYMAHPSLLYDEMSGMENLEYFAQMYRSEEHTSELQS